jgi:ectoine hydroxylase-related dioxygenase (phytanoyl-CoA dioxygenase family)
MKSYGVTQQTTLSGLFDEKMEELKLAGFTVFEGVFDEVVLAEFRKRIDSIYIKQTQEFNEANLIKINDKGMARCLLAYDPYFLNIFENTLIKQVIDKVLGNYYILHLQNAIINHSQAEHHQNSWHRDLPYQNYQISSPLALNAFICIDPFTEKSGSTYVVPYTHNLEVIPSNSYIEKNKVQLLAKPGSVVFFDSMILHKAGYNSAGFTRRAINNVFVKPILKQQINLPSILGNDYTSDKELRKLLGYDSNVPNSVLEWRHNRLNR